MKIDFIDVRRAYFHAKATRNIYVKLPEEDKEDEGKVWEARGTRDEAKACEVCEAHEADKA